MELWSIGHSTHSLDELVALLERHGVEAVADVRRFPGSRRHPQFAREALAAGLPERGIDYRHLPGLGGRRRAAPDSPNAGWRVAAFRAYADHALGEEFAAGLRELRELAARRRTATMCAEALWWRCHRRLIADRLVAGGHTVWHIGSDGRAEAHRLTPFAVVGPGDALTYPGDGRAEPDEPGSRPA